MNKYTFHFTFIFTVISFSVFILSISQGWYGPPADNGGHFCEAVHEGWWVQPTNTWSNIGDIIVGLVCAWLLTYRVNSNKNAFYTNSFIPKFYCVSAVMVGIGSMAMHATETNIGGLMDMNGMYILSSFIFTYSLVRLYQLKVPVFIGIYLTCITLLNIAGTFKTTLGIEFYPGNTAFGIACIAGIIFESMNVKKKKLNIQFKYSVFAAISFALGFVVWQFGRDGHPWCHPNSWFQWHGVWHLSNALSIFFMFKYYTSERRTSNLHDVS